MRRQVTERRRLEQTVTQKHPHPVIMFVLVASLLAGLGTAASAQTPGPGTTTQGKAPAAAAPSIPAQAEPRKAEPLKGEVSLTQRFSIEGADVDPKKSATVGSRLVLTLEVTHPAETVVALPQEQKTGRFELIEVIREPIPAGADPIKETITMVFAAFRPGRHKLLPFELSVMDSEGRISTVKTEAVELQIHSVLADLKDVEMPQLRAPVSVLKEDWTLVWLLSGAGVLLLGGLLGAWIRKRYQPDEEVVGPPPRPAYEVAIEKLSQIKDDDLIKQQAHELFTVRVSEALREYLGRRYNLSLTDQAGLELTTAEITGLLKEVSWPKGLSLISVEQFLYDCDMVKFAGYTPSDQECEALLTRAFDMVERTRPITSPSQPNSATPAGEVNDVDA